MIPVQVIGMGLGPDDLTRRHLEIIERADVLVGGRRHLACFQDHPGEKEVIGSDLTGLIRQIKAAMGKKRVVVLASGDPNFFGIAPLLTSRLGKENVIIHPNISSVQAAFGRIKESWHDAVVVSLHGGRPEENFIDTVKNNSKVAILTDSGRCPCQIAKKLIEAGEEKIKICVLENLGALEEHFAWYLAEEILTREFAELNVVLLIKSESSSNPRPHSPLYPGLPENCYRHEAGLITKAEVRAISLAKLRLRPELVLWDLGAGSGSVSIEASLLLKNGEIIAVEQNPERIKDIEENRRKFKVTNMKVVEARLPRGLENFSPPDRIFIGGGGKDLIEIIQAAAPHLKPGGGMVINTVLLGNLEAAVAVLRRLGFTTEVVQVQISRSRNMPWSDRLDALNPVWIISGFREGN